MNTEKFNLEKSDFIKRLQKTIKEFEQIEYLEKTPILFTMSDISFSIEGIEKAISDIKRYIKVFPIREKRIKELKKIQEPWFDKLEKEGKNTWDDFNKRPWTMDEASKAHSWDE